MSRSIQGAVIKGEDTESENGDSIKYIQFRD